MADQSTPNYRRSPTFVKPVADSMRWANAPDLVSVISCTSNRFQESSVANCTADDPAADHDREVRAENAPDRRDAAIAVDRDPKRDARKEKKTDRNRAVRREAPGRRHSTPRAGYKLQ